ncbi:hypothetical protein E0K89_005215 [Aquicoccus sp. SCR17]|nr:hypothetical protein [Carideicomes alvinocaridis]
MPNSTTGLKSALRAGSALFLSAGSLAAQDSGSCRYDPIGIVDSSVIEGERTECDLLNDAVRQARDEFLDALCALDDAISLRAVPGNYDEINRLLSLSSDLLRSSAEKFLILSEEPRFSSPLPENDQLDIVFGLLESYDVVDPPFDLNGVFSIWGRAFMDASEVLEEVSFQQDLSTRDAYNNILHINGPAMRPAGVFHALDNFLLGSTF